MKVYNVTGMSCAACSARVEKAVSKVDGVTSCAVSLLTNSMSVEGDVPPDSIIHAVEKAGYGASLKNSLQNKQNGDRNNKSFSKALPAEDNILTDRETPVLKRRLISSLGFLLVLMYFSMGRNMLGFPIPSWFENNSIAVALLQMLLAAIVMIINQKFFINGFKGLIHRSPNMDTLVALGSMSSFLWSVYVLFIMTGAAISGDISAANHYLHELYFESAAMILTLITIGKMLEARSKGKTTDALRGLMKLAPKQATVLKDGKEHTVSVENVRKGDIFVVKSGESIPVDGIVIEGFGAVNESALTGESIPVDKAEGDSVSAATINQSGYLKCEASRVGQDTTLSQIIKMVSDASATKAPIAKLADKVSGIFVPVVISIAVLTMLVWLICGREFSYALARGISVLVISCPCALGLATPVAIMVGSGVGARNGILFKTAASLEQTGRITTVVLDKTGTITEGRPVATDIIPSNGITDRELILYAVSLEVKSEHPLARAIVEMGRERSIDPLESENFETHAGSGVTAVVNGYAFTGGSLEYVEKTANISEEMKTRSRQLSEDGKTPLFFLRNNELIGIIAVADTIKKDSPQAISELKRLGLRVVMLTGDNKRTADAIGKTVDVDEVIAQVMPHQKEAVIRELMKDGKVAMIGDGINDAPALTAADIGIAIGAGSDIAVDAADVVLMKSGLQDAVAAVRLSRATLSNIKENLFWAFIYNVIGIPIAAGAFTWLGLTLNPMLGAAAMSLSSFCVVTNALRLNWFKLYGKAMNGHEHIKKPQTIIVRIDGMMCEHCEGYVKEALEKIPGVNEASADHHKGIAKLTITLPVSDMAVTSSIEAEGYKVLSIEQEKE